MLHQATRTSGLLTPLLLLVLRTKPCSLRLLRRWNRIRERASGGSATLTQSDLANTNTDLPGSV
ncbi:unnamed protein product [Brassica rapa subsp. narinosa]